MDDLKDIKQDVKEIRKDIGEIKVSVAINTSNLALHMKRTDLNEMRIEKLEYWVLGLFGTGLVALCVKLFIV